VLTGANHIARWFAESIFRAVDTGTAECVTVFTPDKELVSPNRLSRPKDVLAERKHWAHFALRATLLRTEYSEPVELADALPNASRTTVRLMQRGAVTRVEDESIDAMRALDLDFVLLHEAGILEGDALSVSRFGVWSFHHGDPRTYRGRPSCFWELHDGTPVVSAGIQQLNETLDGGHFMNLVTVASTTSFGATMTRLYRASTTLLASTCRQVATSGELPPAIPLPTPLAPLHGRPSNAAVGRAVGRVARAATQRLWHGAFIRRDWEVGVGQCGEDAEPWSVVPRGLRWFGPRKRTQFWADPCVAKSDPDGATLFVEEFDYRAGYGKIVMLHVQGNAVKDRVVVLDDGHHHAFPQIVRNGAEWVATTDSCCDPAPIYRFASLGDLWVPVSGAFMPPALTDPIVITHDERWLAVGTDRRVDSASWSVAYSSDTLGQPWTPLLPHPLFVDASCARGGGSLDVGRRVRVTQDCSTGYGDAVCVVPWSPGEATAAARSIREPLAAVAGTHTIAWGDEGGWVAADRCVYRFSLFAWRHRLKERVVRRSCSSNAGGDPGPPPQVSPSPPTG
jgi:hypothetical protein